MEYRLEYNVAAIIICMVILTTHILKRKTKENYNHAFTIFVSSTIIGSILDIASTIGNMNRGVVNDIWLDVLNYSFFLMLSVPTFFFLIYAVLLAKDNIRNVSSFERFLIFFPMVFATAVVISNPWTKSVFQYIDGEYARGNYQAIIYTVNFFYTAFAAYYVVTAKDNIKKSNKVYVCMFLGFAIFAAILQAMVPELLLQFFGMSFGELVILLNVQKTDDYINPDLDIFNKRIFIKIVKQDMRAGKKIHLLLLHLEELEFIMDNFGTESRTHLLRHIAVFLNKLTKCNAYYFGSGTFIILVEDDDKDKIPVYEEAIKESFKGKWNAGDMELNVNYKMMYCSMPENVGDVPAFYYANGKFRNMTPDKEHMVHIDDIDFKDSKRSSEVEQIIRRAIENDYFQVYYQPIYSVEEKKIVSAEALIRLIDPEAGFVSPGEFIPIAEKNGQIIPIGDIVFKKVFEFIASNNIRQMGIDYVEINLSVIQCMQRELADNVLSMMKEYGVSEDMINLEITETAVAESPKALLDNMKALGDKGISFAMDDFGTGYSNISALMSLPLDIIKFDKTLIDMASNSVQGHKILESSVTMVKKLGNKIVAEGIEDASQLEMMSELGIDYIQGFYFSKPLPKDDFIKFVVDFNKITEG